MEQKFKDNNGCTIRVESDASIISIEVNCPFCHEVKTFDNIESKKGVENEKTKTN